MELQQFVSKPSEKQISLMKSGSPAIEWDYKSHPQRCDLHYEKPLLYFDLFYILCSIVKIIPTASGR